MKFAPFFATVTAVVFGCAVSAKADFTAYQYKGIESIAIQFDGIDNQGTGSHVPGATTWMDLKGFKTLTLETSAANFSDNANALTCVSRAKGAAATGTGISTTTYRTFEIVITPAAKSTALIWTHGDPYGNGHSFYLNSAGWAACKTYPSSLASGANVWDVGTYSLAAIYGSANFLDYFLSNGATSTLTSRNPGFYLQAANGTSVLGGYKQAAQEPGDATIPYVGKIHSMRFYSRQLTLEETRWNTHLDEARFEYGGTFHVLGFPDEYGTPSPAYGSSSPEGETFTLSPGSLEEYDDGALAAPVSDGVRVKCMGWVGNGDFTVTNTIPTSPVALAGLKSAAWIWQRQYRITAKATSGCPSITLNGVTGATVTKWVAEGDTVTVTSAPDDSDYATAAWHHAPAGAVFDLATSTMTFSATVPATVTPLAVEKDSIRYWRGTTASANRAANWVDFYGANQLPENGSTVILDSGSQDFTWDINDITVGNWIQNGYTGMVTFKTGPGGSANNVAQTTYGVLMPDLQTRSFEVSCDVILNSGSWTHPSQPKFKAEDPGLTTGEGIWRLIVHAGGDFDVGTGAAIDLTGKGYTNSQGPGTSTATSGGVHGGYCLAVPGARPCYGDPCAPITHGSCTFSGAMYNGGGVAEIAVGGEFSLEGTVSSSASDSSNYYGGAGGSIWLTAGSLVGSGTLIAKGGAAPSGSPGAGGRIAVILTGNDKDFSDFAGTMSTRPGSVVNSDAAGTIYRETKAMQGKGELEVCGTGVMSARLNYTGLPPRATDYGFSKVILRQGGRLGVMAGAVAHISAIEGQSKSMAALTLMGGTVVLPKDYLVESVSVSVISDNSHIYFDDGAGNVGEGTLHVGSGAVFTCDRPFALGGLDLVSDAVMNHSDNGTDSYLKGATSRYVRVDLAVSGNVNIASGAKIDVAGRGATFLGGAPGATLNLSGSHGGAANGVPITACYGSVTCPIELGMGGCYNNSGSYDNAYGGGAVKIVAGGSFTLNGSILVRGNHFSNVNYGTGAGGSAWITANSLSGSGVINANGGRTMGGSYGGGGGRVAIYLNGDGETLDGFYHAGGKICAVGGGYDKTNGTTYSKGGAGTVYVSTTTGGVRTGTLTIDNGASNTSTDATAITSDVTDALVDNVIVTNNAQLAITENGKLQVAGTFDTKGHFATEPASDVSSTAATVEFVDASREAVVLGDNEFQNFICTVPNKTIRFGAGEGDFTTIADTGAFHLLGSEELGKVTLRSTEDGVQWKLKVISGAGTEVQYVDVKDSNAKQDGGVDISAKDSKDSGNNLGWLLSSVVIGERNVWTGAADSSWGNAGNWDRQRPPEPTDVIIISGTAEHMPVFAASASLNELNIEEGASLSLAGYDLSVSNNLTVAGSLVCSGSETITATSTNVLFTGGHFTPANSTVVLSARACERTFDPAGNVFHRLVMPKSGSITFANGFKAEYFDAVPTDALTLNFAAGRTAEIAEFAVHGSSTAMVALHSATQGTRWNVKVTRLESVYGVMVRDSAATGLTIYAESPATDELNNDNWSFGGTTARWVGASGGNFSDTNNWSTLAVPDALTRVVFDNSASITLDKPGLVREIYGQTGTVEVRPGTNLLTVTGSMTLDNGSTLSLNSPMVVSNSVILRSGSSLTHNYTAETSPAITNRLHLTVFGDMEIADGAKVNACGKGFYRGELRGPGAATYGASHGGIGHGGIACYGSVFEPTHPGSTASTNDSADGGGIVYLDVRGTLTVNGEINANGGQVVYYPGSGGSVWIKANALAGSGKISANGARYTNNASTCRSGGGRVAVYTTSGTTDAFTGRISAYGSCSYYPDTGIEGISGAAGTVYLASLTDPFAGQLIIDGFASSITDKYAQLPATGVYGDSIADFKEVTLVVKNGGGVSFTDDIRFAEIEYPTAKVSVKLNDHEIFVRSTKHRPRANGKNRDWVDRAVENKGTNGLGHYKFSAIGTKLIVK